MRFLFASAHPYLPQIAGGTQSNTHETARALIARGHAVAVLAGMMGTGRLGLRNRLLMKLTGRRTWADRSLGYPVYRAWHAWEGAARCATRFRPDIAVVQSGQILRMADALRAAGVKLLIYNHNADFADHGLDFAAFRSERFIANSQFTARTYRATFGVDSDVIVPLFDRGRYEVASSRREVLFVNPHPNKGVDVALALARRCPDIPFRFVESWTADRRAGGAPDAGARRTAEPGALGEDRRHGAALCARAGRAGAEPLGGGVGAGGRPRRISAASRCSPPVSAACPRRSARAAS